VDLVSLESKNLFSYNKLYIDFSELTYVLFQGKTGSGKSSVFDILCWIIYGRMARKKYKDIIRNKQELGYGKLQFNINKNKYKIIRGIGTKNKLKLEFFINGERFKYRNKTLIQRHIESILGMDFSTFLNIAYFSQGDIGKFLGSESTERIKIISNLLGLNVFDKAKKDDVRVIHRIENKVSEYRGNIAVYEEYISNTNIKELTIEKKKIDRKILESEKQLFIFDKKIKKINEKLKLVNEIKLEKIKLAKDRSYYDELVNEYKSERGNLLSKKYNISDLEVSLRIYRKYILDNGKAEYDISKLNKNVLRLTKVISKIEFNVDNLKNEYRDNAEVIKMKGGICPRCKVELSKNNLSHIVGIQKDIIEMISKNNVKILFFEKKINKANSKIAKLKKVSIKLNEFKIKVNEINNKIKSKEVDEKRVTELNVKLFEIKSKSEMIIQKQKNTIKNLNFKLHKYDKYDESNINEYEANYQSTVDAINKGNLDYQRIDDKIKMFFSYHKKVKQVRVKINKLSKRYNMLKVLIDFYPKMKLYIINKVVPFIEYETNRYLGQILNGKVIKFTVDYEKMQNKLNIIIYDYENKIERIYEGWSGGERGTMDLSIFLALNKLASIRSGKNIKFLILDEKFANLDYEIRNKVFEMLNNEKHRKIFCISHVAGIETEFVQVFNIQKYNGISNLKRVV